MISSSAIDPPPATRTRAAPPAGRQSAPYLSAAGSARTRGGPAFERNALRLDLLDQCVQLVRELGRDERVTVLHVTRQIFHSSRQLAHDRDEVFLDRQQIGLNEFVLRGSAGQSIAVFSSSTQP